MTLTLFLSLQQSPEIFTPSGNNYFVILPQKDGEAGNFRHIAIVDATVDLMVNLDLFGQVKCVQLKLTLKSALNEFTTFNYLSVFCWYFPLKSSIGTISCLPGLNQYLAVD